MLGRSAYVVTISSLETLEEEEVELAVFGGSLLRSLLDECDEVLLGHVSRVSTQVILQMFVVVLHYT